MLPTCWPCGSDFFDANRDYVEKVAAGYLKGTAELVEAKRRYEETGRDEQYLAMLKMAQDILGADVLPTLEVDAHGLVSDAAFVGLPGNEVFFGDTAGPAGFDAKLESGLALAAALGYAETPAGFFEADFDYPRLAEVAGLTYAEPERGGRFVGEALESFPDEQLDDNTLLAFTVGFEPNQTEFPASVYGPEFQRAIETANRFGNAVVAVRGHADPTLTLVHLVRAGLAKGILEKRDRGGETVYFYDGRPLDLEATREVVALIERGAFEGGGEHQPAQTMQAARNLSKARAEAVRRAIVTFAEEQGLPLDASQIQAAGVGVREPLVAKPTNVREARENMRVEFRLVKVDAEALSDSDFDF